MNSNKQHRINCFKCVHFAVTWNPKSPNSCKFYGFQTSYIPSAVVLSSSGEECKAFEPKVAERPK